MKIQEMRSGNLHLARRREAGEPDGPPPMGAANVSIQPGEAPTTCELDQSIWSVVSFDKCEASGLTYVQAANFRSSLDRRGVNGLCIVTDIAASRLPG